MESHLAFSETQGREHDKKQRLLQSYSRKRVSFVSEKEEAKAVMRPFIMRL